MRIFMQFSANNSENNRFLGVGASPGENPGSATAINISFTSPFYYKQIFSQNAFIKIILTLSIGQPD